jgi:hypothetical protein
MIISNQSTYLANQFLIIYNLKKLPYCKCENGKKENTCLEFRGIDGDTVATKNVRPIVDCAEDGDNLGGGLDTTEERRNKDPMDWEAKIGFKFPTRTKSS